MMADHTMYSPTTTLQNGCTPAAAARPQRGRSATLAVCLAALALPLSFAIGAERLLGHDGKERSAPVFRFEEGTFRAADGSTVPRNEVVDWWVSDRQKQAAAAKATVADTDAVAQLTAYRDKGREMAARFPGCQGVIVIDDGVSTLTADLKHKYRYHFVGLILNEAQLSWGKVELWFTEGRNRQELHWARCLGPDGRLHVLDPAAVKVSRPGRGGVFFDPNSRSLSATIPGVEVGGVVEYVYESESYAPEDWRLWFPGFYFQSDLPVCQSTCTVLVPPWIRLYSWEENWAEGAPSGVLARLKRLWPGRRRNFDLAYVVEGEHAYRSYTWQKLDMPPVVSEPLMPPSGEIAPAVHASVMRDWDHLNQLTGGMQKERMVPTPEIRKKVDELTAGCEDLDQKVARLYHWVQKNVRYISVKSSLSSGWSGHPAAETLEQGYGDCTDKAVLFSTMLHLVGVEAEPVVVRTNDRGRFIPKYPVLACNHCITAVRFDGKEMYLDCTSQDHRFPALRADNHGVLAFNFVRGERETVPVPPGAMGDGKRTVEDMALAPDGSLKIRSVNQYEGMYEARLRAGWKRVPEQLKKQIMQQFLNGIAPGARLIAFEMPDPQDLGQPFTLDYTFGLPAYLIEAGSLRLFQFPNRERTSGEVSLEKRRYPLVYTTSEEYDRTIRLQLAPGLTVVELPPDVRLKSKHVTYTETCRLDDGKVVFHSVFQRRSRRVPVSDYPAYRKTLQQIEHVTKKPMYLEVESAEG